MIRRVGLVCDCFSGRRLLSLFVAFSFESADGAALLAEEVVVVAVAGVARTVVPDAMGKVIDVVSVAAAGSVVPSAIGEILDVAAAAFAVSVMPKAMGEIVDVRMSFVPALVKVNPAEVGVPALSAKLVINAEVEAMNRAATCVSGSVFNARRGPRSGGRVPTLTVAPP